MYFISKYTCTFINYDDIKFIWFFLTESLSGGGGGEEGRGERGRGTWHQAWGPEFNPQALQWRTWLLFCPRRKCSLPPALAPSTVNNVTLKLACTTQSQYAHLVHRHVLAVVVKSNGDFCREPEFSGEQRSYLHSDYWPSN